MDKLLKPITTFGIYLSIMKLKLKIKTVDKESSHVVEYT